PSRENKISSGLNLMAQRLRFLKLHMVSMEDDGNCQFRAIAYELYGNQNHHEFVREKVMLYLKEHSSDFSFYVGEEAEWQRYLSSMAKARSWGDELTLTAAAKSFGVSINVITTEEQNWLLRYSDGQSEGERRRELFLVYISPIHYNVVTPPFG
ncbi:unnamed protein product, partial [Ectocarpus fasciculatus]